jgi:hypothetical protein
MKYLMFAALALFIISCNSNEELIENTYWVRIKNDKTKGLVKFDNNGEYVFYEKLHKKYKYQISSHQLNFTEDNGEVKKYRIISMTKDIIKLEDYEAVDANDTIVFRRAENKDFILGSWRSDRDKSKLYFDDKRIIEMQLDKDTFNILKSTVYDVRKNEIIIDGNPYALKFDNDYRKLRILNNGKTMFDLRRETSN